MHLTRIFQFFLSPSPFVNGRPFRTDHGDKLPWNGMLILNKIHLCKSLHAVKTDTLFKYEAQIVISYQHG